MAEAAREGFFRHREHEAGRSPVLRSSALFYAVESPEARTEFLLFNYWKHKRGIEGLRLGVTVRDAAGRTVHAEEGPLDFPGARTLRTADWLAKAGAREPFEGSVELEVRGAVHLHIPYPAVIARYHGPGWHSTAHSYSRVLSASSGDSPERLEALQATCEGNWTVHPDAGLETFFVIHNGPRAVPAHDLKVTLFDAEGERLEAVLGGISFAPFETRRFFPGRHMALADFLRGKPGCLEVNSRVAGVFPRMLCGHRRKSDGALSVDHSNFNYTGPVGSRDCLPVKDAGPRKPLGFTIPSPSGGGWVSWADFYPTYPDRGYRAVVAVLDAEGRARGREEIVIGREGENGLARVPVSEALKAAGPAGSVDFTISHAERVPTRFHMGIHYQYGGGIPGFLIDGPLPYTSEGVRTRWFPVLCGEDTRTVLMIANQAVGPEAADAARYEALVFNARGDEPLRDALALGPRAARVVDVEEWIGGLRSFLGGEAGWIILRSEKPAFSVIHYALLKGKDSVAVDHAF